MTPSDSNQTTNPYESPKEKSLPAPQQQIARLIDRGWLYRKVQLPGPLATTIEYNGRGFGFETVLVDTAL